MRNQQHRVIPPNPQRHVIEGPREGRVAHFTRLNSQGIQNLNDYYNVKTTIETGVTSESRENITSASKKKRRLVKPHPTKMVSNMGTP